MGKLIKVLSRMGKLTKVLSIMGKLTKVLSIMSSKYNKCCKCNGETYKGFKHPLVHFYSLSMRD